MLRPRQVGHRRTHRPRLVEPQQRRRLRIEKRDPPLRVHRDDPLRDRGEDASQSGLLAPEVPQRALKTVRQGVEGSREVAHLVRLLQPHPLAEVTAGHRRRQAPHPAERARDPRRQPQRHQQRDRDRRNHGQQQQLAQLPHRLVHRAGHAGPHVERPRQTAVVREGDVRNEHLLPAQRHTPGHHTRPPGLGLTGARSRRLRLVAQRAPADHFAVSAAAPEHAYLRPRAHLHRDPNELHLLPPGRVRQQGLQLLRHVFGRAEQVLRGAAVVEIPEPGGEEEADRAERDEQGQQVRREDLPEEAAHVTQLSSSASDADSGAARVSNL